MGIAERANTSTAECIASQLPLSGDDAAIAARIGINVRPGSADDGWVNPPPAVLADGTRLQLFKDGEALRAAYDAIEAARDVVCLEVYILADDDTGRAFADLLAAKARQGVRVYVIYDSFGSLGMETLWKRRPPMFRKMRDAGVHLQEFHPLRPWAGRYSWRPINRDHRKLLVIDRNIAGIGGLNIANEYAGPWVAPHPVRACDLWRDTGVGIVGPAAGMFLRAFARSWRYITRGGRIRGAEYWSPLEGGDIGLLASVATLNSPLRPAIAHYLKSARKSIFMTMAYFAPDDELVDLLCVAAQRGRRVRLMLPGKCDVPMLRVAARSFYQRMLECGVEIHERQLVVLHAKTMVVDGELTVMGSTNLDYRSIEYNNEISAVIRSVTFGRQMQDLFENDVRYSTRIQLSEWRRRPTRDRVVQWAVSRARYLL